MITAISYTKKDKDRLPLLVQLIGLHYLQEPVVRTDRFPLFQWIYCVSGKGEMIIQGKKSILSPGQIALLRPYEPHAYHAHSEEWRVNIIAFSGKCCLEILKALRIHQSGIYHLQNPHLHQEYFEKICSIGEQLQQASRHHKKQNPDRKPYLLELSKLCYAFLLDISSSVQFIHTYIPDTGNETITAMIAYLEEHYAEPIFLDDLAEQMQLSKGYLCDIFKREMGQTIMQYLRSLRIRQAKAMLIERPEMNVGDVGKACGFESASYFGKVFKQIVKVTPENYRYS